MPLIGQGCHCPVVFPVYPRDVVRLLNEAVKVDRQAVQDLIECRVPCNKGLADHPTIQVSAFDEQTGEPTPGEYKVGLLGILNGLFGTDCEGWGFITANFNVWCEKCGANASDGSQVGDLCPTCGNVMTLGSLIGFEVKRWHKDTEEK